MRRIVVLADLVGEAVDRLNQLVSENVQIDSAGDVIYVAAHLDAVVSWTVAEWRISCPSDGNMMSLVLLLDIIDHVLYGPNHTQVRCVSNEAKA